VPCVDVTRLVNEIDPFDLSASIAERGKNAGRDTWNNAKAAAEDAPVLAAHERDSARDYIANFGAWDEEEIAGWSDTELDAFVLQYAAGDLRELQSCCPGDGLGDVDWQEAERQAEAGRVSGTLYLDGDRLMLAFVG